MRLLSVEGSSLSLCSRSLSVKLREKLQQCTLGSAGGVNGTLIQIEMRYFLHEFCFDTFSIFFLKYFRLLTNSDISIFCSFSYPLFLSFPSSSALTRSSISVFSQYFSSTISCFTCWSFCSLISLHFTNSRFKLASWFDLTATSLSTSCSLLRCLSYSSCTGTTFVMISLMVWVSNLSLKRLAIEA